jgi:hypothetical protein
MSTPVCIPRALYHRRIAPLWYIGLIKRISACGYFTTDLGSVSVYLSFCKKVSGKKVLTNTLRGYIITPTKYPGEVYL